MGDLICCLEYGIALRMYVGMESGHSGLFLPRALRNPSFLLLSLARSVCRLRIVNRAEAVRNYVHGASCLKRTSERAHIFSVEYAFFGGWMDGWIEGEHRKTLSGHS